LQVGLKFRRQAKGLTILPNQRRCSAGHGYSAQLLNAPLAEKPACETMNLQCAGMKAGSSGLTAYWRGSKIGPQALESLTDRRQVISQCGLERRQVSAALPPRDRAPLA
jgi:hypothetical protein